MISAKAAWPLQFQIFFRPQFFFSQAWILWASSHWHGDYLQRSTRCEALSFVAKRRETVPGWSYVLHREVITVADLSDNPTPRPWAEIFPKCREIELWNTEMLNVRGLSSATSCFFVGLCVVGSKENSCSLLLEGPGDTLSNKQRKGMVWNG